MWGNQELDVVHKIRIHVFVILLPLILCRHVLTKTKVRAIEADIKEHRAQTGQGYTVRNNTPC